MSTVPYVRATLVKTVTYHHQRNSDGSCFCGWAELGKSHSEHVADMYEFQVTIGRLHTERQP